MHFYQLYLIRAAEEGLSRVHLNQDTSQRPHVDGQVIWHSQQNFRRSVKPALDVLIDLENKLGIKRWCRWYRTRCITFISFIPRKLCMKVIQKLSRILFSCLNVRRNILSQKDFAMMTNVSGLTMRHFKIWELTEGPAHKRPTEGPVAFIYPAISCHHSSSHQASKGRGWRCTWAGLRRTCWRSW